ncbi:MAG: type II toxin-antitoxin system VapC family toxin [Myxococcales bacterium]|nr:type II toxin-antitoxin system VapC family toxin [Myxococcales bacterium]
MASRYLLDTHAWFWLLTGEARIPPPTVASLEAALGEGRVFLSQISTWEIAHKVSIGKIELARPVDLWLRENTEGIVMLDLPLEVVVESTRLPGTFHKDPADRFIVATARVHDLVLVTRDKLILDYATAGHVKVAPI